MLTSARRLSAARLSVVLLVGVIGGCGGGGDTASTTAGDGTATTEASGTSEPGTQAPPSAAPDACSLVTAADVTAVFKVPAAAGVPGGLPGIDNACLYGGIDSKLTIDGVRASLKISTDLVTSFKEAFDTAYLGSGGYAAGDSLDGVGMLGYSALGRTDASGLSGDAAQATVLTASGVTVNIDLGVSNSADQATLRTPANKANVEALMKIAVGRVG